MISVLIPVNAKWEPTIDQFEPTTGFDMNGPMLASQHLDLVSTCSAATAMAPALIEETIGLGNRRVEGRGATRGRMLSHTPRHVQRRLFSIRAANRCIRLYRFA